MYYLFGSQVVVLFRLIVAFVTYLAGQEGDGIGGSGAAVRTELPLCIELPEPLGNSGHGLAGETAEHLENKRCSS